MLAVSRRRLAAIVPLLVLALTYAVLLLAVNVSTASAGECGQDCAPCPTSLRVNCGNDVVECEPGQHVSDGECVDDPQPEGCPEGTHDVDGQCVQDAQEECPQGQHLESDNGCVADVGSAAPCPDGLPSDGECQMAGEVGAPAVGSSITAAPEPTDGGGVAAPAAAAPASGAALPYTGADTTRELGLGLLLVLAGLSLRVLARRRSRRAAAEA